MNWAATFYTENLTRELQMMDTPYAVFVYDGNRAPTAGEHTQTGTTVYLVVNPDLDAVLFNIGLFSTV